MLEGVLSGATMSTLKKEGAEKEKKYMTAAKNVVTYIEMKEGGHYMYGMSFLFSQVILMSINVMISSGACGTKNDVFNKYKYL